MVLFGNIGKAKTGEKKMSYLQDLLLIIKRNVIDTYLVEHRLSYLMKIIKNNVK